MKRFFLFLSVSVIALLSSCNGVPVHASLYDYYNGHLPSVVSRETTAQNCSIFPYSGTYQQNVRLESCLRSNGHVASNNGRLGATIPTVLSLFQTSLQAPMATTDTSTTLVAGTDRQGNNITGTICLTVDSGTPSTEYMCGTASGTAITALTRGIDPLTGKTTVAALTFSHRRGADVRITDYPILTILGRILNGLDTIPNILVYDTTTALAVASTNTNAVASVAYVNSTTVSGAPNAGTNVKGIVQEATDAMLQSSSSTGSTGARTYANGGSFTQTSTANKVPVSNGSGNLDPNWINTSSAYTWSGTHTFNGTTTLATTTISTTTITTANLTSSTIGQLNIAGNNVNTLLNTGFCKIIFTTTTGQGFTNINGAVLTTTTIPGGLISTSSLIHGRLMLTVTSLATSKAIGMQLTYGGTSVTSTVTNGANNAITANGFFDFYLIGKGATNSQTLDYTFAANTDQTYDAANPGAGIHMSQYSTAAIDTTVAQNLNIQSSSSNASVTVQAGFIEFCPQR